MDTGGEGSRRPLALAWVTGCFSPVHVWKFMELLSVTDIVSLHFNAATKTPSHSAAASQDPALEARE
jgi:hypothetical protein